MKRTGMILLAVGIFLLIAAILFAMSVGGVLGLILLIGSVAANSAAVMLLMTKKP